MAQYRSVFTRMDEKKQAILTEGGQVYLDKASQTRKKIGRLWGGHTNEARVALSYLKDLTPAEIADIKATYEAANHVWQEVCGDPASAMEIIKSIDSGVKDGLRKRGIDYLNDAAYALSDLGDFFVPYLMALGYLRREGSYVGSTIESIDMAWPKD